MYLLLGLVFVGVFLVLSLVMFASGAGASQRTKQTLAHLEGPESEMAHVCLPAPHPAVRALLAAGWHFDEFDLFMATEPGLVDARRAVPSPALA